MVSSLVLHLMDAELSFIFLYPGKTVIITTHYIEEARGADRVGFMRAGRFWTVMQ